MRVPEDDDDGFRARPLSLEAPHEPRRRGGARVAEQRFARWTEAARRRRSRRHPLPSTRAAEVETPRHHLAAREHRRGGIDRRRRRRRRANRTGRPPARRRPDTPRADATRRPPCTPAVSRAPICAPPSPSPPHAHPPPLSQTHAFPSATPYVPARPSCPRSFSPNVSTVPSAASATEWYRPVAHETIFTSLLGMATRPKASPRPPRPSWPASFTGGEPCPPPPAESLRPAVYSAPASVTSAE